MRWMLIFGVLFFSSIDILGCESSIPDHLFYQGRYHAIYENLRHRIPVHKNIVNMPVYYRGYKVIEPVRFEYRWMIQNKKLYLIGVYRRYHDQKLEVPFDDLFDTEYRHYPIFADWYSGVLQLEIAEKQVVFLKIQYGEVIKNIRFGEQSGDHYRTTSDYYKELAYRVKKDHKNWIDLRLFQTDFVKQYQKSGAVITTRGILIYTGDETGFLLPKTEKTKEMKLPVKIVLTRKELRRWRRWFYHEVKLFFQNGRWQFKGVKHLKNGETLYHPDYPLMIKKLKQK